MSGAPPPLPPAPDRHLRVVLVVSGVVLLCALPAAVMPTEWMRSLHAHLLAEPLHDRRLTEYLTRTVSGLYASLGAVTLFLATDVRRYRPVIVCKAVAGAVFGTGTLALDVAIGMPWFWTAAEGPSVIGISAVTLWLTRRAAAAERRPAAAP